VHPHHQVLELVFLMVILKIPIAYLCYVVYYAIKAKPVPPAGAAVTAKIGPEDPSPRFDRRRRLGVRPRPHGGPTRSYPRTARAALAAKARR
jgi:hypothetical protein